MNIYLNRKVNRIKIIYLEGERGFFFLKRQKLNSKDLNFKPMYQSVMLNLQVLQVSYQSVEKATPQAQNEISRSTTTCILFLFFLLVEDLQCSIKIVIFFLILHREVTTLRRFLDFQWSSTTENNRKQYKNTD